MGCDIHTFIEARRDDRWELAEWNIADYRNYTVFALLADVRNEGSHVMPLSVPRGFPPDCSWSVLRRMPGYGHSASYFTREELERFRTHQVVVHDHDGRRCPQDEAQAGVRLQAFLSEVLEVMSQIEGDTRLVFFFDN